MTPEVAAGRTSDGGSDPRSLPVGTDAAILADPQARLQPLAVEPVLGTERDVAAMTRLGRSTVRRLRARGAIPGAVKVGRSRRYILAIVAAWASSGCPSPSRWPREWTPGGRP